MESVPPELPKLLTRYLVKLAFQDPKRGSIDEITKSLDEGK